MAEKLSGCESIYCNLVKNITHIDRLPENAINDIKVAGQVSSTDVVFKSASAVPGVNGVVGSTSAASATDPNGVPATVTQYDSISQTSSLGSSSTSLSTNGSTDSPNGTSASLTDSGNSRALQSPFFMKSSNIKRTRVFEDFSCIHY